MNRREILTLAGAGALGAVAPGLARTARGEKAVPATAPSRPLERDGLQFWLQSSLERVYPNSPPGDAKGEPLVAARSQKLSFQACFRNTKSHSVRVRCDVTGMPGSAVTVRRVGFVPLRNL